MRSNELLKKLTETLNKSYEERYSFIRKFFERNLYSSDLRSNLKKLNQHFKNITRIIGTKKEVSSSINRILPNQNISINYPIAYIPEFYNFENNMLRRHRVKPPIIVFDVESFYNDYKTFELKEKESHLLAKGKMIEEEIHALNEILQRGEISNYRWEILKKCWEERKITLDDALRFSVVCWIQEIVGDYGKEMYLRKRNYQVFKIEESMLEKMVRKIFYRFQSFNSLPSSLSLALPVTQQKISNPDSMLNVLNLLTISAFMNAYIMDFYLRKLGKPFRVSKKDIGKILNNPTRKVVDEYTQKIKNFVV